MESFQRQQEPVSQAPARRMKGNGFEAAKLMGDASFSEPSEIKKPRFPKDLFDKESKFINPKAEASILLPQQSVASAQIVLEAEASARQSNGRKQKREMVFSSIYEYLSVFFTWVNRKFARNRRARARLTARGQEALDQLRYLSMLCDATTLRSPEEVLAAESAFGEAYYEIMNLSSNLEKMAEQEANHHLQRYGKHMAAVLSAAD